MKKLLLPAFVICICLGCNKEQQTAQIETVETSETVVAGNTYGQKFDETNVMSMAQLQEAVQTKDSVQAVVAGEIVSSCQSKGCWMDIKMADNSTMKVTFRDYGFFLPIEDLSGKNVVFTGTAKRELTSVEDQRHYAQDAGKSQKEIEAITSPKDELRFVADGVIIK